MSNPQQRRNGAILSSSSTAAVRTQLSPTKLLLTFVLLGIFVAAVSAIDEKKLTEKKTVQPATSASPAAAALTASSAAPRDEIYIDDEGIEGSGGRGEIHDDLEKDPDYSGSGFGPDDEDSSTDQHYQSINKQSGKQSPHSNLGNDDFITNSRNSNKNRVIGSGGNTGLIDSGSTSINTIGKDHQESLNTNNNNNNNHPSTTTQHTTSTSLSSSSSSAQQPSSKKPLLPNQHHTSSSAGGRGVDDDDEYGFDLDETVGGGAASGDGPIYKDDEDGDDDDVDDEDGDSGIDKDIISRVHHTHDLDVSKQSIDLDVHKGTTNTDNDDDVIDDDDVTDIDDEIKHHINPYDKTPVDEYDDDHSTNKNDDGKITEEHDIDVDEEEGDEDDLGTDVTTDEGAPKQPGNTQGGSTIHELDPTNVNSLPTETKVEHTTGNEVLIMNTSDDDRTTSFFAQPGILAAVIGGAVVGLLCAILVVMFIVYRMRKKDEGSYALDEPKRSPAVNSYAKNANNREFYA